MASSIAPRSTTHSCSPHRDVVALPSRTPYRRIWAGFAHRHHQLTQPLQRAYALCGRVTTACSSTVSGRLISMQPVVFNAVLDQDLTLVGTFVFATSGALLAVRKNYDIVGMTVLAEITATGGGIVRDLVLGAVPPAAFTDHVSFLLPLGAVLLTFFAHRQVNRIQTAVLVFDAAGLA